LTTAAVSTADDGALFSVIVANRGGSATGGPARLTVRQAPQITADPASVQVQEGNRATFTVTATGSAPLAFQWRRNGADISEANAVSLAIAAATLIDSGSHFDVLVTNTAGSATSAVATLTVKPKPPIVSVQDVTVNEGVAATFTASVTSSAPVTSIQWRKGVADIAGATSASFTTPVTAATDDGTVYSVVAANAGGTGAGSGTLHVRAAPRIISNPATASVVEGQLATFTVAATGFAPLAFQWHRDGTDIPGATNPTFSLTTTIADNGARLSVTVSNQVGNVLSTAATLTVTPNRQSFRSRTLP
jgi:hypothetical protein